MRNLHKLYNKEGIPWISMVLEKYYSSGKLPIHIGKGFI